MENTFEASLKELEQIVAKLEDGDLPLEESLTLFERGVKLSRECRERLANAERRIETLLKDSDGNLTLRPLEPMGNDQEENASTGKRIVFNDN